MVVKLICDILSNCNQLPSLSSTGWGRVIPVERAIASIHKSYKNRNIYVALARRALPEKDGFCSMGNDSTGILAAVPSVLTPEPPGPDCPEASLVHSAHSLLEPRVSGCKQNFVGWLFRRLSKSPIFSTSQTETLLLFRAGCYLGSFLALLL